MYAHYASVINYVYSTHHGYDFIVNRCPRREDVSKGWMWDDVNEYVLVWSKPSIIRQYLPHYDIVFFIDSDAVVFDMHLSIEKFLTKHNIPDSVSLIISQDCIDSKNCNPKSNNDSVNTGVMIFKNTPRSIKLLDTWIAAPNNELCEKNKYVHTREQACLHKIIETNEFRDDIRIMPVKALNGIDGDFVRHYMATTPEFRTKTLGDMMCSNFLMRDCRKRFIEMFDDEHDHDKHNIDTIHNFARHTTPYIISFVIMFVMSRLLTTYMKERK